MKIFKNNKILFNNNKIYENNYKIKYKYYKIYYHNRNKNMNKIYIKVNKINIFNKNMKKLLMNLMLELIE